MNEYRTEAQFRANAFWWLKLAAWHERSKDHSAAADARHHAACAFRAAARANS